MPNSNYLRLGLACLAGAAALLAPAAASAKSVAADLRVLDTDGRLMTDQRQLTDTVAIKTDPRADCFGPGTGGSGNPVQVAGPTALGIVKDASEKDGDLRPVSVTDAFSFGLGICGIGGAIAKGSASWYVKVNHVGLQVGGDQFGLRRGDDVLWYLAPSFPYPNELALAAPARVVAGQPFTVRVTAFDDAGKESPVAGATVTGAVLPTGPDGTTTMQLSQPVASTRVYASNANDIPAVARICAGSQLGDCPKAPGERIVGTRAGDRIKGTPGPDRLIARAGNDRVNVRGGGLDRVFCGAGRDRAVLGRADKASLCERVRRP